MTGSNCRPPACKADALPAELIAQKMVTRRGIESVALPVELASRAAFREQVAGAAGFEPTMRESKSRALTDLAMPHLKKMAPRTGLEPVTP